MFHFNKSKEVIQGGSTVLYKVVLWVGR